MHTPASSVSKHHHLHHRSMLTLSVTSLPEYIRFKYSCACQSGQIPGYPGSIYRKAIYSYAPQTPPRRRVQYTSYLNKHRWKIDGEP